ncbi:MAG: peroxide stress protein YaaA [Sulfurimonas sp.]|nr:MAG: peroxide stress protein YaaA [Sulfurimonas sp.]
MTILFSPSEAKHTGGASIPIAKEHYLFPELFEHRVTMLRSYNDYMATASEAELKKLLGTKKESVIAYYRRDLFTQPTMKVIERYCGVAYDYLDYACLSAKEQAYIDRHVIIFSNLFGPLHAGDIGLPEYKLKQGEKIGTLAPEIFYKQHFTQALHTLLAPEHYLDLRAGFYNKFYQPSSPYTTLKFIKEGKVVSHWAKAYRGIVLRCMAQQQIHTIDDFMAMELENLVVKEIRHKGIHTEIVYHIIAS